MNFSSLVVVALAKLGKEGSKGRYRGHGMGAAWRGVERVIRPMHGEEAGSSDLE